MTMSSKLAEALSTWAQETDAANKKLVASVASGSDEETEISVRPASLIPAYFDPTRYAALWQMMIDASSKIDITAIANPSSGPGESRKSNYTLMIAKAKAGGVRVLGYVASWYGKASAKAKVLEDIESWYSFYPTIDGIFFDQQSSKAEHITLYTEYFNRVRSHGGYVASNPGMKCDEGYLKIAKADALVLWENAGPAGTPTLLPWANAAPDLAVSGMIHSCDLATMKSVIPKMKAAGFGQIFVTKGNWSTLGDFAEFVKIMTEAQ